MALVEGKPRYVTAVSRSDVTGSWRERRQDGGIVMDIETNEIVASGFSIPHSPRFYRGKLWLLNSGEGEFGYVDTQTGQFEPVAFCPGYMRGLAFWGNYAIVGLSKPRDRPSLSPFDSDPRLEPLNSLGLRDGDEVVGWMVTHRVAPDTIRYSTLFVAQGFQKLGRGISLLAEAIKRQIASPVPNCTWSVVMENQQMAQFLRRRLAPYTTFISESRQSGKRLKI